jgi:hypothetical protein
MRDDQRGIADRIGGKRRGAAPRDSGSEAFRRLPYGKRPRFLLLNASQTGHRIRLSLEFTTIGRPGFDGRGHRAPRTDSRLTFVALIPGLLRRRKFPSNA